MPLVFYIWFGLLCLVGIVWVSRHLQINRAQGDRKLSPDNYTGDMSGAPKLSVLVAAKDEEDNIEACVRTLMDQDYPNYEMIVIDDRSSDKTPVILAQLQTEFADKLTVMTIEHLAHGWFGKNNAMRRGMEAASGNWFCFSDADCRQTSRRTLSVAMGEVLTNKVDFLSVLPNLETKSFWEHLIQPVCSAVLIFWFHPDRVNNPKQPAAYANGAFMLMNRKTYDAIGGHERVKTEVNEDIHMARLAKEAGQRLFVIPNDDLYVTRMYSSLGECWRGWSRIFYGCLGSFHRLAIAILVLSTFSLMPWCSLLATAVWRSTTAGSQWLQWIMAASAVVIVLQESVMIRFYRLTGAGWQWALGYFPGGVICLGMLCNAICKLGGSSRVVWRGTAYRGHQVESEEGYRPSTDVGGVPPATKSATAKDHVVRVP